MPLAIQAGLWSLLGGSTPVLGTALAYLVAVPARVVASIQSFTLFAGSGPATAVLAAGAVLAMVADSVIAEVSEAAHGRAGLITAAGLLAAFAPSEMEASG